MTGNFSSLDLNQTSLCEPASDSPEKDVIGNLLQSSGPFLFPCTIEYSLICAVILFEIWKHVRTLLQPPCPEAEAAAV